jgi:hypothetical protein
MRVQPALVMERQTLVTNPVKPSHLLRQGRPLPKKLSQDQVRTLFTQITNPLDHALYLPHSIGFSGELMGFRWWERLTSRFPVST